MNETVLTELETLIIHRVCAGIPSVDLELAAGLVILRSLMPYKPIQCRALRPGMWISPSYETRSNPPLFIIWVRGILDAVGRPQIAVRAADGQHRVLWPEQWVYHYRTSPVEIPDQVLAS